MPVQRISDQSPMTVESYFRELKDEMGDKWEVYVKMMIELIDSLERHSQGYTIWVYTSLLSLVCAIYDSPTDGIIRIEPSEKGYQIIYALDFIRPSLNMKVAEQNIKDVDLAASTIFAIYKQFADFYDSRSGT